MWIISIEAEKSSDKIQHPFVTLKNLFRKWAERNHMGFLAGSDGKESACNAEDLSSIPGSGRSPGEGNGYPLQYSCLKNSMDKEAWWPIVHRVTKSQT